MSELSSCSNCYMAKCFPEKSGRCRNEELGALSSPTDWIPRYNYKNIPLPLPFWINSDLIFSLLRFCSDHSNTIFF